MRITATVLALVVTAVGHPSSAQTPGQADIQSVVEHAFVNARMEAHGMGVVVIQAADSDLTSRVAARLGVEHRKEREVVECAGKRCSLTRPVLAMILNRVKVEGDSAEGTVITWQQSGFEPIPIAAKGLHVMLAREGATWRVTKTVAGPIS